MIPAFEEGREADGKQKASRLVKGQKRVLGAATGGDMSDLFAREDERRDALNAERNEAWRYKSCERKTVTTRAPRPRQLWPTAKTAGGVVWPATNANTAVDGT